MKGELLAPAGSPTALKAAVQNGADAVYLGLKSFSARAGAANFTPLELYEAADYCHVRGVKVFLAVNTLFFGNELLQLEGVIEDAAKAGVDAFIVQDFGAARMLRQMAPHIKLHASTQMTLHSLEGARLLEKEGFSRVVLSRELRAQEIKYICENTELETEVFVHGALCVCYSGRCLLSSMIGGRSGNRGSCAQPCRLPFTMEGKKGYLLSPKDLCLVDDIAEMQTFPVTSFKLEGRMKSPEYVAIVTQIYRKAIDGGVITGRDKSRLREIFCRGDGFTRAYYGGEKDVLNTEISNNNTGRTASKELLKAAADSYREGAENRKTPVKMRFYCEEGVGVLEARQGAFSARVSAQAEQTPLLTAERIKEQLSKMGQTPFYAEDIEVDGAFSIRVAALNQMRRDCAAQLQKVICANSRKGQIYPFVFAKPLESGKEKFVLSAFAANREQALFLADKVDRLYLPVRLYKLFAKLSEKSRIYALLPGIIKKNDKENILHELRCAMQEGAAGVVCDSLDAVALTDEMGLSRIGGFGLGITNAESAAFYLEHGLTRIMLSPELSAGQIRSVTEVVGSAAGAVIYGRLPLMITQAMYLEGTLLDRMGAEFPVRKAEGEQSVIYNSRPLYLADRDYEGTGIGEGALYFTLEGKQECAAALTAYREGQAAKGLFTRGYWR